MAGWAKQVGERVIILSTCLCHLVSHAEEHSVCLLTVAHVCDTLKTAGSSWLAAMIRASGTCQAYCRHDFSSVSQHTPHTETEAVAMH